MKVRAKKSLGQHFLTDEGIAENIVGSLKMSGLENVLEVGPGTGILTGLLLKHKEYETTVIEIDRDSVTYLRKNFPQLENRIIEGDFLRTDLHSMFNEQGVIKQFAVIGNFPYNISSQIFFKILENKEAIPEVVCMLQEEVAQRICSAPGTRAYGILSVFLQAWYNTEYLFGVPPRVFDPPPKVQSAVIRLIRNSRNELGCDEKLFQKLVKQAFNQRRKMLRNSIKSISPKLAQMDSLLMTKRPEQLSVKEFVDLTNEIQRVRE